ncbi:hypothetical protein AB0L53_31605 [Nonomuraea sp. NPDC052129]|uniref:hypothetical protein n=1 Tax=Nonomuraea sp. NPDC052129 TaxID=3154651 RepID=UPI003432F50D
MDSIMLVVLGWPLQRLGEQDQLDKEQPADAWPRAETTFPRCEPATPARAHNTAPAELGRGDRP